jgi:hypothetical protein
MATTIKDKKSQVSSLVDTSGLLRPEECDKLQGTRSRFREKPKNIVQEQLQKISRINKESEKQNQQL